MVEINYYELILQIFIIGLLLFLLKKFLYIPMNNYLEKRAEDIKLEYDNAEKLNKQSEIALKHVKEEMETAKLDAKTFIENTLAKAENEKQQMIAEAEHNINLMLQDAKINLKNEIDKAKQELKIQIADIPIDIATKIIESEIYDEGNKIINHDNLNKLSEIK